MSPLHEELLAWSVMAGVVAYVIARVVRSGGLRAALFNARIVSSEGDLKVDRTVLSSTSFKVLKLTKKGAQLVGLQVSTWLAFSFTTSPVVLTREEARALARLLDQAAE